VWDSEADGLLPPIDRNRRATINVTDLLGTTGAVVDLLSGDLVEVSTYYPNGARENLWTNDALVPLEPMGFTTKEADEEIGVTYFGERWLIPRLGRWATADPLHVHAAGGGEALNSYHYVSGSLLQASDPMGLQASGAVRGRAIGGRLRETAGTAAIFESEEGTLADSAQLGGTRGAIEVRIGTRVDQHLKYDPPVDAPAGRPLSVSRMTGESGIAIGLVRREASAGPARWVQFYTADFRTGSGADVTTDVSQIGGVAYDAYPSQAFGNIDTSSTSPFYGDRGVHLAPEEGTGEIVYDSPRQGLAMAEYLRQHATESRVESVLTFSTYLYEGNVTDIASIGPTVRVTWQVRQVYVRDSQTGEIRQEGTVETTVVGIQTFGVSLSADEASALRSETRARERRLGSPTTAPPAGGPTAAPSPGGSAEPPAGARTSSSGRP
jgi:RHS repeat-associated protein